MSDYMQNFLTNAIKATVKLLNHTVVKSFVLKTFNQKYYLKHQIWQMLNSFYSKKETPILNGESTF